ncbi:hypothetical protein HZH66_007153 [Vespula vulgaris]|uniref:Uncharacterized protein n=1 Tax=Vespula vulgaris TaxID=7454 RepID=A0A834JXN5_VESVU|nr:hypothetical protein HZH66_007153 [Vespula vulgaris]
MYTLRGFTIIKEIRCRRRLEVAGKIEFAESGVKRGSKRTDEEGHIPKGERKRVEQSKSDRIKASYTFTTMLGGLFPDRSCVFLRFEGAPSSSESFNATGNKLGEKFRYGHPVIALRNSLEGRFRNCRTNNLTVIRVPCESFEEPSEIDTPTLIKIVNILSTKVSISVRRWSFQFLEWRKSTKGRVVRMMGEGVGPGGVRGDKGDEYGKRKRRVMVDE